jgi:flagellar M-ring protein FliF
VATTFDPSAVLNQLTQSFMKLPLIQKIMFPLLIVGSVSGIVWVANWANKPDYVVLFSDLKPTDSAGVITKLKEKKIKYEVRGDGSSIAVSPPEVVHELRIELAGEGVPQGGVVGLEIFEATNLGTTTFQEKIKFQRAIQGELERTISSLDAVRSARVHLAQPEKSVFTKRGSEPTASVMLQLENGGALTKAQVKGITNLVAGSVEGLKSENVTLIDVRGNLLSVDEENEDALTMEATRLQYQREMEKGFVQRIEQMLSKVLGPNKVIARVSTDLDFSSTEREEESYDPGGQVVRSQRTVSEGSGAGQRGGVPGVAANLTNDPNLLAPKGQGDQESQRKEEVKNYEVSRAVSKTSSPRGRLTRLSVAVLVDGAYEKKPDAPADAPAEFKALDAETIGRIESVVKSAVGFDSARGDTVTVENIAFHAGDNDFTEEMSGKATQDFIFNMVFRAGPLLFILLFFMVIVKPLVKFLVTPTEAEVDLSRLLPTGIQDLEKEIDAERTRAQVPTYEPTVDLEQLEQMLAENSRIVKENPQQAALLIRYWLNDGRL